MTHRNSILTPVLSSIGTIALLSACGDDPVSFSQIYQSDSFQACAQCHAPQAPGATEGTEATQDWSSRDAAYASLQMTASGMIGNFVDCNGVPFIGQTAEQSLLVAVFDADVRAAYNNPAFPDCNADTISDMTLKIGMMLPDPLLADLKAWIDDGAPDE